MRQWSALLYALQKGFWGPVGYVAVGARCGEGSERRLCSARSVKNSIGLKGLGKSIKVLLNFSYF